MKISGTVKYGKNRGKALGFPTANVVLDKNVEQGIYISIVQLDDKTYKALTFIGAAETFDEKEFKAEVYILDFNEDIYGKEINVELLKKIRDVKKFSSPEELKEKMKEDEKTAREYFES